MQEIRGLTGLRGIAALIVLWAHVKEHLLAINTALEPSALIDRMFFNGGRQVDIFFVLSGFVMTLVYQRWFQETVTLKSYATFMQRRMARIYPLHLFMLLAILCSLWLASRWGISLNNGAERFSPDALLSHVLLIHAWDFILPGSNIWNPPSWSVSIEFLAYLFFPGVIWLFHRWSQRSAIGIILLCLAAGFTANAWTHWGLIGWPAIARGLPEFALGCAVAFVIQGKLSLWLQTRRGSVVAAAILLITYALVPDTGFIIAVACAPLLLTLCGKNPVSWLLGTRPIYFLGEISYSVYLGHFLFSSAAYRFISPTWMAQSFTQAIIGGLLLTLFVVVCSTITYYLVEQPARRWFGGRRKKPAASQSTQTN
ncbi:acyltransferase family protein [Kerstersia sp.]|uniref:acyltransferase family protein n=1 Tax=Kerstersia sp. TaxID=1930783 RepID=UPI003F8F1736